MFNKPQKKSVPDFSSRSQAFDYMFSYLAEQGEDLMTAARKADDFASVVARNKGIPDECPKPQTMMDKVVGYGKQIVTIKKEYPEVWDLAVGAIGGVIGAFVGVKATDAPGANDDQPKEIDFDNLQGA